MTIERGGKTVFGATLGILMLESRFPRIPGDMGNALTWPFPVQYRVVKGASPEHVVLGDPRDMTANFIAAGHELVAAGCDGITTNCGFLALIQDDLKSALGVPVATSSLMQAVSVQALLPPAKRAGILPLSAATLTAAHLDAARVPKGTAVAGVDPDGAFARGILGDAAEIDFAACRNEVTEAACKLVQDTGDLGAIVLECTNMVPYADDVRRLTGLPVYSSYTFATWFQSALLPRRFETGIYDPRTT